MEYVAQLTSLSKKSFAPQEQAEKASETLDSWLGK